MTSIEFAPPLGSRPRARVRERSERRVIAAGPDEPIRRALNLAVATVGVVLTAPLMMLIACLIKLTSRGPVFYSQPRAGGDRRTAGDKTNHRRHQDLGGRPFTIYKFRPMHTAPAAGGGASRASGKASTAAMTADASLVR